MYLKTEYQCQICNKIKVEELMSDFVTEIFKKRSEKYCGKDDYLILCKECSRKRILPYYLIDLETGSLQDVIGKLNRVIEYLKFKEEDGEKYKTLINLFNKGAMTAEEIRKIEGVE